MSSSRNTNLSSSRNACQRVFPPYARIHDFSRLRRFFDAFSSGFGNSEGCVMRLPRQNPREPKACGFIRISPRLLKKPHVLARWPRFGLAQLAILYIPYIWRRGTGQGVDHSEGRKNGLSRENRYPEQSAGGKTRWQAFQI